MCGKTSNILLVDDSIIILEILTEVLQDVGYNVISFSDPIGAMQFLMENTVDILITDYEMQPIKGDELIELASTKNVRKKIIMSGLFDEHTYLAEPFKNMGAITLAKPFEPEDLLALLNLK